MEDDGGRPSKGRLWLLGAAGLVLLLMVAAPLFTCGTCQGKRSLRWSERDYPCATCDSGGRIGLFRVFLDRFR